MFSSLKEAQHIVAAVVLLLIEKKQHNAKCFQKFS